MVNSSRLPEFSISTSSCLGILIHGKLRVKEAIVRLVETWLGVVVFLSLI